MSVAQVAAEAQAVVDRACSLFGSSPEPVAPADVRLRTAAESVAAAGQRGADLSIDLVDRHREFVVDQTERLSNAGRTDTDLQTQMTAAATVTQAGARKMDAIAAQTHAIAQAAAVQTPAAQRVVLAALRSQVAQANDVVNSAQRQAGELASQVRALSHGYA